MKSTNKDKAERRIKQFIEWGYSKEWIKNKAPEKFRIKESIPEDISNKVIQNIM